MRLTRPSEVARRASSTPHYQTFPTRPPTSKGRPPSSSPTGHAREDSHASSHDHESPLPMRQLFVLAVIALSEQTAFNSIGPYLPQMAGSFPDVDPESVGVYVGLIASAFALAQFGTNFFWGWLSDRIGRKPVVLIGTLCTAACFLAFGFCKRLWQAILVQALMGVVNGNQGVVSTCLGEITDRSNQSKAFTYLPVIYGIGAITGPAVGGLLLGVGSKEYPYLPPNLFAAGILLVDLAITMVWLDESLEEAKHLPPLGKRVGTLFTWLWQFTSSSRPSYLKPRDATGDSDEDVETDDEDDNEPEHHDAPNFLPEHTAELSSKDIFNRDTMLLLATYLVFQLSNVAYNSLFPIFAEAAPPTGRDMSPKEVGLLLSFAGAVTIVFQVGVFGKFRDRMGNKATYRVGLAGFVVVFFLMPFIGYKDLGNGDGGISSGEVWLWIEVGVILLIKTIATVGGLTSALLLVSYWLSFHTCRDGC
jgi:MFS family permease